jgi:transcription initiation factor IIF auxiliary subunit
MKLIAELNMDKAGQPLSITEGHTEHFSIALKIKDAPETVRRVRYVLHPTYKEPVRSVPARVPQFEEPITSYGDYEIKVEYDDDGETKTMTQLLSKALDETHGKDAPAPIRKAIEKIREH